MIKAFIKKFSTLFVALFLIILYAIATTRGWLDTLIFPTIQSLIEIVPKYANDMVVNLISSFSLLIPGLLIASGLGIVLGVIMGSFKQLHDTLNPIFNAISPLPATLLSPYALRVLKGFRASAIFMIAFGAFWPIFNATMNGVMTIDKRYLDKAATVEAKGVRLMFRVILPAAMPTILSGLVSSMRVGFILLVVAEMYGVNSGLGYFIQRYSAMGSFKQTTLGFIVLAIALVTFLQVVEHIKKRILHWTMD